MLLESATVEIDLNNPTFQENLFGLEKDIRHQALETLRKIRTMRWDQVYADKGLHWEKISSVRPPKGIPALYSLRINKSRRATAWPAICAGNGGPRIHGRKGGEGGKRFFLKKEPKIF